MTDIFSRSLPTEGILPPDAVPAPDQKEVRCVTHLPKLILRHEHEKGVMTTPKTTLALEVDGTPSPLRFIQRVTIDMDAASLVPQVTLTFIAGMLDVVIEGPVSLSLQELAQAVGVQHTLDDLSVIKSFAPWPMTQPELVAVAAAFQKQHGVEPDELRAPPDMMVMLQQRWGKKEGQRVIGMLIVPGDFFSVRKGEKALFLARAVAEEHVKVMDTPT